MGFDPASIICEVLGQPSYSMRNPANAEYQCPYLEGECIKRSQQVSGPYPVCSIFQNRNSKNPVCVCPRRFNEISVVEDIIANCWPGTKPLVNNVKVINEIKLGHLGTMDMVLVEVDSSNQVQKFVSVELQAVDITGSYFPAYTALTNSEMMHEAPRYGFNWKNVYKRYVTQLINKGFQHSQWGTIIVSVMQDVVLERILEIGHIIEAPVLQSNVVFMGYKMEFDEEESGYKMVLNRVFGTTHANIVNGHLYKKSIDYRDITSKLQNRLH